MTFFARLSGLALRLLDRCTSSRSRFLFEFRLGDESQRRGRRALSSVDGSFLALGSHRCGAR